MVQSGYSRTAVDELDWPLYLALVDEWDKHPPAHLILSAVHRINQCKIVGEAELNELAGMGLLGSEPGSLAGKFNKDL